MPKQNLKYMSTEPSKLSGECQKKTALLIHRLGEIKQVALAFSGGVDSTFLLWAAKKAGLETLVAITLVSQFFTQQEKERAVKMATSMGVAHICLDMDVLAKAEVVENTPQRCYFCKHIGFSLIRETAGQQGIHALVHGVNLDDLADYRPGLEAAKELGFTAPLVDAGFSKKEIRVCSKQLGLETWDLPSQSCLATRISYYEPITQEKLDQVDRAERFIKDMGFNPVRVRCHGNAARIEIDPREISAFLIEEKRQAVSRELKKIGFDYVSCDLEGYQSGKMNKL